MGYRSKQETRACIDSTDCLSDSNKSTKISLSLNIKQMISKHPKTCNKIWPMKGVKYLRIATIIYI